MSRLIWSPDALADIARMYRFLATKNTLAAREAVKTIRSNVKVLAQHPEIGRPSDEMDAEYRELPIPFGGSGYIALYHFDGDIALIVAVRHQLEVGY